jgi:hypothetical protein
MEGADIDGVRGLVTFYKERIGKIGEISDDLRTFSAQMAMIELLDAILLELHALRANMNADANRT